MNQKKNRKSNLHYIGGIAGFTLTAIAFLFLWESKTGTGASGASVTREEAREIFTPLHNNIYAAFKSPDASDAYDRLEKSTDKNLLEKIFSEMYLYFLKKQQGGPSVEIMSVKIRDFEKLKGAGFATGRSGRFRVKCSWDVLSIVTHFGHWHPRSNNYQAIYTLEHLNGSWKITEDNILWQRRIKVDLKSFES